MTTRTGTLPSTGCIILAMQMPPHPHTNTRTTPQQLVDALDTLGVHFLRGGSGVPCRMAPDRVLAALAVSSEARLRLAIIPLMLAHPEFSGHVVAAWQQLSPESAVTLQCYYTAAYWLQRKHWTRLTALLNQMSPLPDHFGVMLGVAPNGDPDTALRALAVRQQRLSGRTLNWAGTYEHAVQSWLRQSNKVTV